ncbi:putative protein phosphatase 2C 68 [Panicum miliaceum]|uniref:protein-serine/threonine phosphatase n=1 Tax=Panicum miliaceum TaxID=4540 RepID=A0A3L6SHD7_PANMI|nr:putative protein phosphatase 2C 68 [Panicum miliaceum]
MAQVCCDSASATVVVGPEVEAGRWKHAPVAARTAEASTRKRHVEAGELLVARKHDAALVAGRRREVEDAVSVHEAFTTGGAGRCDFYRVFNGHDCSHVAEVCQDRMHELLAEELAASVDEDGPAAQRHPAAWNAAMKRCFTQMDAEVTSAGCVTA